MKTQSIDKHVDTMREARKIATNDERYHVDLTTQLRIAEALERIANSMEAGARNERARA